MTGPAACLKRCHAAFIHIGEHAAMLSDLDSGSHRTRHCRLSRARDKCGCLDVERRANEKRTKVHRPSHANSADDETAARTERHMRNEPAKTGGDAHYVPGATSHAQIHLGASARAELVMKLVQNVEQPNTLSNSRSGEVV